MASFEVSEIDIRRKAVDCRIPEQALLSASNLKKVRKKVTSGMAVAMTFFSSLARATDFSAESVGYIPYEKVKSFIATSVLPFSRKRDGKSPIGNLVGEVSCEIGKNVYLHAVKCRQNLLNKQDQVEKQTESLSAEQPSVSL